LLQEIQRSEIDFKPSIKSDRCEALVRDLVLASFGSLQGKHVRVAFVESDTFLARSDKEGILLNKRDVERMRPLALIGLLVHELSHMENRQQLGRLKLAIDGIRYVRYPKYRTQVERETDRAAIAKGYGLALLALHEYHNQNYEDYDSRDGLTQEEIKAALAQRWPPEKLSVRSSNR
jgi:hypothetical protein